MDFSRNAFGEKLIKNRKKSRMTQKDLADKLGVSDRTVSRWENGTAYPDYQQIKQMEQELRFVFTTLDEVVETPSITNRDTNELKTVKNSVCLLVTAISLIVASLVFMIILRITPYNYTVLMSTLLGITFAFATLIGTTSLAIMIVGIYAYLLRKDRKLKTIIIIISIYLYLVTAILLTIFL